LCVGGIISLPWFSKELKTTYRITIGFMASSLYLSFTIQYLLGGGFPFWIVLVPQYKLSLCYTPIKPDLLGFPRIGVFAYGLCDHVWSRGSHQLVSDLGSINQVISFWNFCFLLFPQKFLSVQFLLLLEFAAYKKKLLFHFVTVQNISVE
jgi:hypothetical protein